MKAFNWLHLTDLHFGLKGQTPLWPNIRAAFWDDLERLHAKCGPWDAVFFTGDLVQTGKQEEFEALEEKVLGPLWEHLAKLGSPDAVLLASPGNHDLERPSLDKPRAALRLLLQSGGFNHISEEFWNEQTCEYREIVSKAFSNYSNWSKKNPRNKGLTLTPGCLPGDFAATLDLNKSGRENIKVGIVGINSTFIQLNPGDYLGRLMISPQQVHQACGGDLPAWIQKHDVSILVTHQGPDWLDPVSKIVYNEINPAGRFSTHLFGHMHEHVSRSTSRGGGAVTRHWQGNSLFSAEKYGEPPQLERRHGYAAGRIEFTGASVTLRQWPRCATNKNGNGWRFIPDHESYVLDEHDNGTLPEQLNNTTEPPSVASVRNRRSEQDERHIQGMELRLQNALQAFKGQPITFLDRKLSRTREFNDDPNELTRLMAKPSDTLIMAPPEFGLTCLGLHLQLEAFRNNNFWLYIDCAQTKGRKILEHI